MKTTLAAIAGATFLTLSPIAFAQDSDKSATSVETKNKFWEASFPGGNNYLVALGKIASVSKHEYIVQGAGRIHEVTVATDTSVVARFYFVDVASGGTHSSAKALLNRAKEVAGEVADRTGTERIWEKVVKDYPVATHAHTVEFRLQSLGNLQALYSSVKNAWMRGKGARLTIKDE